VIMPAALLTCLLTPLGLDSGPLWVFEKSLGLLTDISATVSSWPGANIWVAHPPFLAFILIVLGGLWLCLWQQPWRRWGLVPIGLGAILAFRGNPPQVLIDGQGKLVAIYKENSLHLSSMRKGKFTAKLWQKHLAAKELKSLPCENGVCEGSFDNIPIVVSYDKENQPCLKGALLIRLEPSQKSCPEAYLTLDWYDLWRRGSHSLWLLSQGPHLEKVRTLQGKRPWTRKAIHRKDRPMYREEEKRSLRRN